MRITKRKLRILIESLINDVSIVQKLNIAISDAKKAEEEFRATRDDVHKQPPEYIENTWGQIDELILGLGMNENPPKELSVHRVVDPEEGEILASYLTYDEAVAYGRGLGMVPTDESGRKVSTPFVDDRGNLYYVYPDSY